MNRQNDADQPWTGTSFEVTNGAARSGPVASPTPCSTVSSCGAEGSEGGTSTGLSCTCAAFALETLGFEFKVFGFVTTGLGSALAVPDTWDVVFVTDLWTGFLAGARGLLFSATSFTLPEFAVLRGLSHTEPSAEAAVAEVVGLCRPSFGDLARVGGICTRKCI